MKPDIVFFSNGSCFDLSIPVYSRFIRKINVPFLTYLALNTEHETLPYPRMLDLRYGFQSAASVIFSSRRNLETAERQIAGNIDNAVTLTNPPTCTEYPEYPWPDQSIVRFAMVARLNAKIKGQPLALAVLADERWRKREWHLDIFGKGPDEQYIRALVEHYDLQDKVSFRGYATDVGQEIWAENHVLLMPSLYEGCPISLYDAALFGRPAIVSDVGGNAEFVLEGENGFVAAAPSVPSFSDALERAWNAKGELSKMGQVALERASSIVDMAPENIVYAQMQEIVKNGRR
ncbi:glycosyltransferase family 4 protein [Coraliomargarita algicola]|uniref:Glycosyltransferase family 4 protein n=1 Tax=Coraliomargarita algicola TaxID=3092156 RepID=A0ABZ0RID2_9BACT|nr:glycosyltransferase family 4 protein [Coraliomargarita sp. J2-16]WPJ95004.1 glycosyltransferase family 4 protein [Coraliomargarita sp. J2-16]